MKKNNLTEKTIVSFERLGKAINRLEEILLRPADADRANVDATIQRFEFCIELYWKALKRLLSDLGKEVVYPKEILREAYQGNIIDKDEVWLAMLNDRNQTSHTYDEELADKIYENIKKYSVVMRATYASITKKFLVE